MALENEKWQRGRPPQDVWVLARHPVDGIQEEVRAVYGKDGVRPHWVDRDGGQYFTHAFTDWQPLPQDPTPTLWDHLEDA